MTAVLQSTPRTIPGGLFKATGGKRTARTFLRFGDRIIYRTDVHTISFGRDGQYLYVYADGSDDKLLIPPGLNIRLLVPIICAATGLSAHPVEGTSSLYLIWDLR